MKAKCRMAFLGLATILCVSCSDYQRARQVRTFTDMQTIVVSIERMRSPQGELPAKADILLEVSKVEQGRDAWGVELLLATRVGESTSSYVLVSFGSDGKPDMSEDEYFNLERQYSIDDTRQDIVFRDGRPITLAGK